MYWATFCWSMDIFWVVLRINMGSWVKISDLVISMETDRYLGSKYGYGWDTERATKLYLFICDMGCWGRLRLWYYNEGQEISDMDMGGNGIGQHICSLYSNAITTRQLRAFISICCAIDVLRLQYIGSGPDRCSLELWSMLHRWRLGCVIWLRLFPEPKCTQMNPNALKWSLARFYAKENDEAEVPPGSPYKWYSPNLLLKIMSSAAGYILGRFRFSRFIMMGNFSLPALKNFPTLFPPFTFRS